MAVGDDAPLVGLLPSIPARSIVPVPKPSWLLVRPERKAKYFDLRSRGAVLGIGEAVIVGLLRATSVDYRPPTNQSCLPAPMQCRLEDFGNLKAEWVRSGPSVASQLNFDEPGVSEKGQQCRQRSAED